MDDQRAAPGAGQATQTRICSNPHCEWQGNPQPLNEEHYQPDNRYSQGYRTECRRCQSNRAKQYNKQHPQKATVNKRKWVRKNKDHVNAYQRQRYREMADAYKEKQEQDQTA